MHMRSRVSRVRGLRSVALGAVVVAAVAACAGSGPEPTTPGAAGVSSPAAAAPTKPRLTAVGGTSSVFIPLWVAEQQGYLADRGLTVDFTQVLQFPTVIEALTAGQADAATLTWVTAISAAATAPGPKLVMATGIGFPVTLSITQEAAQRYGVTAAGPFAELSGLRNSHLRVAAGDPGLPLYVWLTAVAGDAGLTAGPEPDNDLVLVPGAAGPPQLTQWNQGLVDAVFVTNEFLASAGLADGVPVPVGRTAPSLVGIGGSGIGVSEDLLDDHPETVQALVDAAYRGLQWAGDPANKAAVIQMMVQKLSMPEAGATAFYDEYQATLARGADVCMTDAAYEGAVALANAGRPSPITVAKADVVDGSFCEATAAGR